MLLYEQFEKDIKMLRGESQDWLLKVDLKYLIESGCLKLCFESKFCQKEYLLFSGVG